MSTLILSDRTEFQALVLDDYLPASAEAAVSGELYYRPEDDSSAEPVFVANVKTGTVYNLPFEPKDGRSLRFFLVGHGAGGRPEITDLKEAAQKVFEPAEAAGGQVTEYPAATPGENGVFLSHTPTIVHFVFRNDILVKPADYTVAGDTIIFDDLLEDGDFIAVSYSYLV